ncbi:MULTISPECIES: RNA 2',3'-cyclic phosphodiesterase [unclassified Thioalkalivibrio]|uniref:RNA 2',3'-cyclic phosphodiesterase n=1 Tax=unclassified Thioalkalivibrio TaxID=2621013 RepID=UPI0003781A62|nr:MULTISPECIES: RNA 2',3'-cyclic phosphodiesterase [unclassified Thioalkalivibrio]
MNDVRRVFLALWPDDTTRGMLDEEAKRLGGPGRPIPRAHLHLTLAFAGTMPATQADCIAQEIGTLEQEVFPLTLDRLGHFERARVSWIAPSRVPAELDALANRARDLTRTCGATPEDHPFRPHVTLRRFALPPESNQPQHPIQWNADEVVLIESGQGGSPGPYRVIARTRLSS